MSSTKPIKIKLEYILVGLAIICFLSTIILQVLETRNFNKANASLESIAGGGITNIDELNQTLTPFVIWNSSLNFQTNSEITNNIETLQSELYKTQISILHVYNFLIFVSFFLIALATFVIAQKFTIKKNKFAIQNATNESRLIFSREVHDGLAQDLAALKVSVQNNDMQKVSYFANHAFNESRFLIEELQVNLTDNFVQNVREMLSNFEINFSIQTDFLCASQKVKSLPQKYAQSLLRILNEALSNIARHSKATLVKVKIVDIIEGLRFIISDNGGGKKVVSTTSTSSGQTGSTTTSTDSTIKVDDGKKHFGLKNIKLRAKEMNGNAEFNFNNEYGGTTIAITIPNFVR